MVDGDEVCARGKGALDLELGEGAYDGREDMAATEHGLANGHEVGNGVPAIADELYAVRSAGRLSAAWGRILRGGCSL